MVFIFCTVVISSTEVTMARHLPSVHIKQSSYDRCFIFTSAALYTRVLCMGDKHAIDWIHSPVNEHTWDQYSSSSGLYLSGTMRCISRYYFRDRCPASHVDTYANGNKLHQTTHHKSQLLTPIHHPTYPGRRLISSIMSTCFLWEETAVLSR